MSRNPSIQEQEPPSFAELVSELDQDSSVKKQELQITVSGLIKKPVKEVFQLSSEAKNKEPT